MYAVFRHFFTLPYARIIKEVSKSKGRKEDMKADTVEFKEKNKTLTAAICCEIDHHTAKDLRERIDRELFISRPNVLVMDFSGVGFMDSSGIALILGRAECAGAVNASVIVTGLSESILKLIRISGVERISNITVRS